jgi:hypothetical protein
MEEFYFLDSASQVKDVNRHIGADLHAFQNTYNVYDFDKQEDLGDFRCLELSDLLEEIKEMGSIR